MTAVRVRRATSPDAEAIADVHLVSRSVAMPWLPRVHTDEETLAWVCEMVLPSSDVRVAVAGRGAAAPIVGYVVLDGDVADHLYVLPHEQLRGIGTLLLDVAKEASPGGLTLTVLARNAGARAFYVRHGLEVIDTDDGSSNEEGLADVTYRWCPGRQGTCSPRARVRRVVTAGP